MPSAIPTGKAEGDGQSSGSLQTVLTEGASEQAEGAMRSSQEANHGSCDWNGGAEVALPDVDGLGQVLDVAQVDVRDWMDMQAVCLPAAGQPTGAPEFGLRWLWPREPGPLAGGGGGGGNFESPPPPPTRAQVRGHALSQGITRDN